MTDYDRGNFRSSRSWLRGRRRQLDSELAELTSKLVITPHEVHGRVADMANMSLSGSGLNSALWDASGRMRLSQSSAAERLRGAEDQLVALIDGLAARGIDQSDAIQYAFQALDKDGSGLLSNREFSRSLQRLGVALSDAEMNVRARSALMRFE